jgi:hypothetical protein
VQNAAVTAGQLQDLLVARLARAAGGSARRWRVALGPVHLHDLATHAHCNWSVRPSGGTRENSEIERLLDTVRLDHPIVTAD